MHGTSKVGPSGHNLMMCQRRAFPPFNAHAVHLAGVILPPTTDLVQRCTLLILIAEKGTVDISTEKLERCPREYISQARIGSVYGYRQEHFMEYVKLSQSLSLSHPHPLCSKGNGWRDALTTQYLDLRITQAHGYSQSCLHLFAIFNKMPLDSLYMYVLIIFLNVPIQNVFLKSENGVAKFRDAQEVKENCVLFGLFAKLREFLFRRLNRLTCLSHP